MILSYVFLLKATFSYSPSVELNLSASVHRTSIILAAKVESLIKSKCSLRHINQNKRLLPQNKQRRISFTIYYCKGSPIATAAVVSISALSDHLDNNLLFNIKPTISGALLRRDAVEVESVSQAPKKLYMGSRHI